MRSSMHVVYAPLDGGGVKFAVYVLPADEYLLSLNWERRGALDAAASILRAAGIARAVYGNGTLTVLEES